MIGVCIQLWCRPQKCGLAIAAFVFTFLVANTAVPAQAATVRTHGLTFDANQPIEIAEAPPGPEGEVEYRFDWGRAGPGIGMLAAGYALNALASVFAGWCVWCDSGDDWGKFRAFGTIPLAGPFLQLTAKPNSIGDDAWAPWLITAGAVQVVGLTLLLVELLSPSRRVVRDPSLVVVPTAGPHQAGLSIAGRM